MNIRKLKRLIRTALGRKTSEDYSESLREKGISVGKKTVFFAPYQTVVDVQRSWLVEIGEYCKITQGVVILAHDYSRSVIRRIYGEVIAEARKTVIGNNVFIGMNSIILMGTHVGNNVIIGAGSVVHGNIPDNVVIAGNPARIICTLEDYHKKRKEKSIEEAMICSVEFNNRFGRRPTVSDMGAFYTQYLPRSREILCSNNIRTNVSGDEEEEIIESFLNTEPTYSSFEEFLDTAFDRIDI